MEELIRKDYSDVFGGMIEFFGQKGIYEKRRGEFSI
jgi:hypothetical protein